MKFNLLDGIDDDIPEHMRDNRSLHDYTDTKYIDIKSVSLWASISTTISIIMNDLRKK
jgi:hypothetical protein